jgi:hypothetical protein
MVTSKRELNYGASDERDILSSSLLSSCVGESEEEETFLYPLCSNDEITSDIHKDLMYNTNEKEVAGENDITEQFKEVINKYERSQT